MNALAVNFSLTADESAILADSERVIESGLKTFIEIGSALLKIRNTFKGNFPSIGYADFETYCRERWGFKRHNAYDLIETASAALNVEDIQHPRNREVVRPLTSLPPEQQREAFTDAVERTGGTPTGRDVQAAVERVSMSSRPRGSKRQRARKSWFKSSRLRLEATRCRSLSPTTTTRLIHTSSRTVGWRGRFSSVAISTST